MLNEFVESLIKGDRKVCLKYVDNYITGNPDYIQLYEEVFKKSLYDVGELWEYNKITVATEHLATSITEFLLNHVYNNIKSSDNSGKRIILACTEKEEHQVGIKMVADVFENNGWETFFLGANIPSNELIIFINSIKPDLLALSLSIYFNLNNLEKMIKLIRTEFPDLPIIIGGQAFRHGGKDLLNAFDNIKFIPDLYSLELFIKDNLSD